MNFILVNLFISTILFFFPINSDENIFNVTLLHRTSPHLPSSSTMRAGSRGEYYMEYWIGSSNKKEFGQIDTGSDLFWQQCEPCIHCYNQTRPIFDPNTSTTHTTISYHSEHCEHSSRLYNSNEECGYYIRYADNDLSMGTLRRDIIHVQTSPTRFRNFSISFGCGNNNVGHFGNYLSGVIGLNRGRLSIISQMGITKFSYCLPQYDQHGYASWINFGTTSIHSSDEETVTIPLGHHDSYDYRVSLTAILVEGYSIPFVLPHHLGNPEHANMIIDIGSGYSYIYDDVFRTLVERVESHLQTGAQTYLETECFMANSSTRFPDISLKFEEDHHVVHLPSKDVFFKNSEHPDFYCLSLVSNTRGGFPRDFALLGAFTQANFVVGFDIGNHVVHFKPYNCVG